MKTNYLFFLLFVASVAGISCNDSSGTTAFVSGTENISEEKQGTQWVPVALNKEGETVSAFVTAKDGKLIAGTSAGIYLSKDKGNTWQPANINAEDKAAVFSLTIDGSGIIYAGLSRYGVLVSSDNGATWKLYNNGLNKGGPRSSYAMVAAGTNILKGSLESGVYLSSDKGQNWQPSNNGIPLDLNTSKMVSVVQLVQNANTVYALTDLGVRYSNDKGKTWNKPAHNGIEKLGYMVSLTVQGNTLFTGISTGQKGVFVSADNGENWKPSGLEGKAPYALFSLPNGSVYAGCSGEVYRSTDKGKTWTLVGSGLPENAFVYAIGITPGGQLLAGVNRKGIFLLK